MNIGAALKGKTRLYFDTSPFIYYIEENPQYIAKMDAIIAAMSAMAIQGVCSVVTLTEVLPVPLRTGNTALAKAYQSLLTESREFQCVALDVSIAQRAAYLRAEYTLKTPDALHLATAIVTRCDAFLTNDLTLQRV
jgi:predicted nucleic acid-binding protein